MASALRDRLGGDEADRFALEDAGFLDDGLAGQQLVNPEHVADGVVRKLQLDGGFLRLFGRRGCGDRGRSGRRILRAECREAGDERKARPQEDERGGGWRT